MDNDEVLGHLLKIESEAAALVNNVQAEADRRVLEAEKQNHAAYEERYRSEGARHENEYQALKEKIQRQYQTELEAYSDKISSLHVDVNRFSALLDKFVTEEV
jgi:F0F1-type ATP synthase membrane subunit b/b'